MAHVRTCLCRYSKVIRPWPYQAELVHSDAVFGEGLPHLLAGEAASPAEHTHALHRLTESEGGQSRGVTPGELFALT